MENLFSSSDAYKYRFEQMFLVDDIAIPDPYAFSGEDEPVEALNEQDATGVTHYASLRVRHTIHLEWNLIDWSVIMDILALVRDRVFRFTFPDPAKGDYSTVDAVAKNVNWGVVKQNGDGTYMGKMSFTVEEL